MAYGYVTRDTAEWLGYPRTYNELHMRVTGDRSDVSHIQEVAAEVEDRLERSGLDVHAGAGSHARQAAPG